MGKPDVIETLAHKFYLEMKKANLTVAGVYLVWELVEAHLVSMPLGALPGTFESVVEEYEKKGKGN